MAAVRASKRGGPFAALSRWLRNSRIGQAVATRLGAGYIRLVIATTRWTVEGREHFDAILAPGGGVIAVMWHGRLFLSPSYAPLPRRTVAMISRAGDGDVITGIVGRWGVETVRGSTYDRRKRQEKGGAQAFEGAERALREGAVVAITPDGPRGPRMHARAGAAELAARVQAPVIGVAFSVSRGIVLKSWDRFLLPLPFGRGVIFWSEPLTPPAADDPVAVATHRVAIEAMLTELTDAADDRIGRDRIVAAPPEETEAPEVEPSATRTEVPQVGASEQTP
ncbi:MAG: lysophospholipid acyltransferase family protein [Pseudomonadota bacterium]